MFSSIKVVRKAFIFSVMLFLAWFVEVVLQFPSNNLRIVGCDVGQGDAFLVSKGFTQVLIDGGPDKGVMKCLRDEMPFWDQVVELVVLTHPQEDHYEGLIPVLETYEVSMFVSSGFKSDVGSFEELRDVVRRARPNVLYPTKGDVITIGQIQLKVLWPAERIKNFDWSSASGNEYGLSQAEGDIDPNSVSVVLALRYGEFDALFTGDIGTAEERALRNSGVLRPVEFLKVAHHGSKFSSSLDFIREIEPQIAVIGVGEKNTFGHPTPRVIDALESVGARVFRTDIDGTVVVVSDGKRVWVE